MWQLRCGTRLPKQSPRSQEVTISATWLVALARVLVWLIVLGAILAVVLGLHWAWIVAALAVALAGDVRDALLRATYQRRRLPSR